MTRNLWRDDIYHEEGRENTNRVLLAIILSLNHNKEEVNNNNSLRLRYRNNHRKLATGKMLWHHLIWWLADSLSWPARSPAVAGHRKTYRERRNAFFKTRIFVGQFLYTDFFTKVYHFFRNKWIMHYVTQNLHKFLEYENIRSFLKMNALFIRVTYTDVSWNEKFGFHIRKIWQILKYFSRKQCHFFLKSVILFWFFFKKNHIRNDL